MTKRLVEINKGMRIGGPFDGTEHLVIFFPDDHPEGYQLPKKWREIDTTFNSKFPEGATYHWNAEKKEWHYVGQMDQETQNGARMLFDYLGEKPADPL